ncbi:MAG: GyrI-like domain-containing protein [Oscillospiraceae bacterium]|jgi:predicted transcriptional regulator YdeE|nr:GyrI-like domain-containing protein [Oscillospiraceae bacterium]
MSEFLKLEIVDFPEAKFVGKMVKCSMEPGEKPIKKLWDQCSADGTFGILEGMADYVINPDYADWMGEYDEKTTEFVCLVGMIMKPGCPVPGGFASRDIPATKMAVGYVRGSEPDGGIYEDAGDLTLKAMADQGYEYDDSKGYMLEIYNKERFAVPVERGDALVVLDNYMPIKSK